MAFAGAGAAGHLPEFTVATWTIVLAVVAASVVRVVVCDGTPDSGSSTLASAALCTVACGASDSGCAGTHTRHSLRNSGFPCRDNSDFAGCILEGVPAQVAANAGRKCPGERCIPFDFVRIGEGVVVHAD